MVYMCRRLFFTVLLGILFFEVSADAQGGSDGKLRQILDGAVSAVGTPEAIGKIKSIDALADCTGPNGVYSTRITTFGSNKAFFRQTFSYRDQPTNIKINGDAAWNDDSPHHSPELITPFRRLVTELHEFQRIAYDFEKFFAELQFAGEVEFNDSPHNRVSAKTSLGGLAYLYFDERTKLLSGYQLLSVEGEVNVTNVFGEWRDFGPVKLPVTVTATDSAGKWTLNFHSVEFNNVDERIFDTPPRVADMVELLRLHKQAETAHLSYDAELFVSMFDENLTQIQRGDVLVRDKASNLKRFENYFASFKFDAWEDIVPPVIKISGDGTLATVQVQKRVSGRYKDADGKEQRDKTIFAWLEVWEKTDGKWKVVTVASTDKPGNL